MVKYCQFDGCNIRANFGEKHGNSYAKWCSTHKHANNINCVNKRCEFCNSRPSYGIQHGSKYAKRCANHKLETDVNCFKKVCIIQNCDNTPKYKNPNEKGPKRCNIHKLETDVNIQIRKMCLHNECKLQPSYGELGKFGSKYAKWCSIHAPNEYVNVLSKRCEHKDCYTIPTYGPQFGKKFAKRCNKHKLDGDIDTHHQTCENCDKLPSYGQKYGSKYLKRCADHRLDTDVQSAKKKCEKCENIATYGLKIGTKFAKRCSNHKSKMDVYVYSSKKCESCDTSASFGRINEQAKRCYKHKFDDDVRLYENKCESCDTRASFGKINEKAKRCSKHKFDYDINLCVKKCEKCHSEAVYGTDYGSQFALRCKTHKLETDIYAKKRLCEYKDCNVCPCFGQPDENILKRCKRHKIKGDVNLSKIICENGNCVISANFGQKLGYKNAKRCNNHRLENDINVRSKICDKCGILHMCRYKACSYCRPTKTTKDKELKVVNYLLNTKEFADFAHNKISAKNPQKYGYLRPDILYNFGTHIVIVEVDENQHKRYGIQFEMSRMKKIHQGLELKPIIFIRFNPDGFKIKGVRQKLKFEKRMEMLCKTIDEYKNGFNNKLNFEIKYLYYDQ